MTNVPILVAEDGGDALFDMTPTGDGGGEHGGDDNCAVTCAVVVTGGMRNRR